MCSEGESHRFVFGNKNIRAFFINNWQYLFKLQMFVGFSSNATSALYPIGVKASRDKITHKRMFSSALFIVKKNNKVELY